MEPTVWLTIVGPRRNPEHNGTIIWETPKKQIGIIEKRVNMPFHCVAKSASKEEDVKGARSISFGSSAKNCDIMTLAQAAHFDRRENGSVETAAGRTSTLRKRTEPNRHQRGLPTKQTPHRATKGSHKANDTGCG